ncbi:hypothetical protein Bbelb_114940 [Branchiostoma belcheri]|nr:hypothetical protein Bbelb_114940 [Branchiostoma belcheri]
MTARDDGGGNGAGDGAGCQTVRHVNQQSIPNQPYPTGFFSTPMWRFSFESMYNLRRQMLVIPPAQLGRIFFGAAETLPRPPHLGSPGRSGVDARHLHGCARCKSVVCTLRLAVSGCVHYSPQNKARESHLHVLGYSDDCVEPRAFGARGPLKQWDEPPPPFKILATGMRLATSRRCESGLIPDFGDFGIGQYCRQSGFFYEKSMDTVIVGRPVVKLKAAVGIPSLEPRAITVRVYGDGSACKNAMKETRQDDNCCST